MDRRRIASQLPATISILGLTLLAGCSSWSAPPLIAVEQLDWTAPGGRTGVQILTDHYDLRTTIRDSQLLDHLAPFMETAYASYAELMPPARNREDRLVVYLFGTRPEWARFTQETFPTQAHTYLHIHAGGFVDARTATAVIHDIGRDRTLALLAHEGFHQYVAHAFPQPIPPWLNEGIACQYEGFELRGDRPVFTPRRNSLRKNHLRAALGREGELVGLSELLRMHAGEAVVKTGPHVRTYYAQVWSLILYLQEGAGGDYADGFAELLGDAGTERLAVAVSAYRAATPDAARLSDGEVLFRHYITEDLDRFMADYRDFGRYLVN